MDECTYTLFARQYDNGTVEIRGSVNPVIKPRHPSEVAETPKLLANAYFSRGYCYRKDRYYRLETIARQKDGKGFTDIPLDESEIKEFEKEFLSLMRGKRRVFKRGDSKPKEDFTSQSSLQFQEYEEHFQE